MGSFANYLSTTTGNMQNAKLPVCMNAVTLPELDEGSEKANVVSTIAVAVCSLVTTFILIVAMIFCGLLLGPVLSHKERQLNEGTCLVIGRTTQLCVVLLKFHSIPIIERIETGTRYN